MSNLLTYLRENAKDPAGTRPLAEVDFFALCYLVYFDFRGIVPAGGRKHSIALKEAAAIYKEKVGRTQTFVDADVLEAMACAERFANARLFGYEDEFQAKKLQFAALGVAFEDGTKALVFRGVDERLTGWQEAFTASYHLTQAQKLAAEYLERHVADDEETENSADSPLLPKSAPLCVCGHSKGGNLALMAALNGSEKTREKIDRILLFDSPGPVPGLYSGEVYETIKDRVTRVVPAYCLIGRLFTKEEPDLIVQSDEEGVMQHVPLSWQIAGDEFVPAGGFEKKSLREAVILDRWISRTNAEERKSFTRDLFESLRERRGSDKQKKMSPLRFALHAYFHASKATRRAARKLIRAAVASKFKKRYNSNQKVTA